MHTRRKDVLSVFQMEVAASFANTFRDETATSGHRPRLGGGGQAPIALASQSSISGHPSRGEGPRRYPTRGMPRHVAGTCPSNTHAHARDDIAKAEGLWCSHAELIVFCASMRVGVYNTKVQNGFCAFVSVYRKRQKASQDVSSSFPMETCFKGFDFDYFHDKSK